MTARRGAAWLLAATLVLAAACGDNGTRTGGSDAPPSFPVAPPAGESSLLLVSLDTFRADAAGCGGDPAARTPWLDRLARGGVQFRHGWSSVPLTLPSHATMLTGRTPPAHGVRDNGTFRLPADVPTLAERLRERGFATGAFIAAFPLDARFGLDSGFDVYDDERGGQGEGREADAFAMERRGGEAVTAAEAKWLASVPAGRRIFAFVHLFEAHSPWMAPEPRRIAAGGDGYRAAVAEADRWLGAAVRATESRGGFRVCVVADHGESLGEHGETTHGLFVYDATLAVPAVIWPRPADGPAGLRDATFRLVDFPATAFRLLGLPPEEAPGEERPAAGDAESAANAEAAGVGPGTPASGYFESYYGWFHHGWSPLRGFREGDWKYVEAPVPELYDLAADPGEVRNVAADHPERVAELADRTRQEAARAGEARAERIPLDEEARSALESLGYATGPASAEAAAGTDAELPDPGDLPDPADLPDPKQMVKVLSDLERAQAALAAGQPDAALGLLRDAVSRDPRNKDLHHLTGLAHAMAGRPDWAVDSFRRALELPPHRNDRATRYELARAWLSLGDPARAKAQLDTVLAESPDDAASWYHMGLALSALGRPEEAAKAWDTAVREDPGLKAAVDAAVKESPDTARRR